MPEPRIAVMGCGQWGQNHVRTLAGIGRLGAISDSHSSRAHEIAHRYGVPALNFDDILQSNEIDAAVLALPPRLHGRVARRLMEAGKDVLVEKPIALDVEDARATQETARQTGRVMMVGHVLRYHPVFQRLCEVVEEGRIGAVRHIIATRLGLGRFLGMDAVWDLAPHDLSLVLKLAGGRSPQTIETLRRTVLSDETDVADIRMDFGDGLSAEVHVSRVSPFRDRRLSVVGTEGMITFDDLAPEGQKLAFYAHRVWREDEAFAFRNAEPDYLATEPGLPLDRELRHFIHCIETRSEPETGAAEAVETVRILSLASPLSGTRE